MNFLKKLSGYLKAPIEDYSYWVNVRCNRCGEMISTRVDLRNDPSVNYSGDKGKTYFCRKVLIGEKYCFQKIEVLLTFDKNHKLIDREINGGVFVDDPDVSNSTE